MELSSLVYDGPGKSESPCWSLAEADLKVVGILVQRTNYLFHVISHCEYMNAIVF